MLKSQQCTKCYGMFKSQDGKHERHTDEKTNTTPKGTQQQWICFGCREKEKGASTK